MTMQTLGGSSIPTGIMIYPNNFDDKDKVLDYLDKWNKGKKKADKIVYTDMSNAVTTMTGGLLNGITTILVAFAAISLITSMIMIGILTYTSVLERTKEIGVLKALGARKKDITRVFDAETFILGVFSGVLGIFIAYLLTFPINTVIYNITDLANVAQLDPKAAIILIIVSTVLTLLGGHIPARMAAKKDAAIALRSE
jgi:putative ABC transport system permease protein